MRWNNRVLDSEGEWYPGEANILRNEGRAELVNDWVNIKAHFSPLKFFNIYRTLKSRNHNTVWWAFKIHKCKTHGNYLKNHFKMYGFCFTWSGKTLNPYKLLGDYEVCLL